jgi:hypothetical protein
LGCSGELRAGLSEAGRGVYDASLHAWRAYGATWEASVDWPPVEPPPGTRPRLVQHTSARCYVSRPGYLRYARAWGCSWRGGLESGAVVTYECFEGFWWCATDRFDDVGGHVLFTVFVGFGYMAEVLDQVWGESLDLG